MANLLPCPFCGKPTEYVCENDHHGDYFRLGCTDEDCPAHWTYYTEPQENAEECIRRWNTRAAQPPAAPVETDAVRRAFCAADDIDWAHLDQFIPQSGHGRFWKAVFAEVRTALSSDGEPSNGKQPLMASRPAPPVPSDPNSSAETAKVREYEDGETITFLDAKGDQHTISYDIREDREGLGSGWILVDDETPRIL